MAEQTRRSFLQNPLRSCNDNPFVCKEKARRVGQHSRSLCLESACTKCFPSVKALCGPNGKEKIFGDTDPFQFKCPVPGVLAEGSTQTGCCGGVLLQNAGEFGSSVCFLDGFGPIWLCLKAYSFGGFK